MSSVRTTLMLEEVVFAKLKQVSHGNISRLVNECLKTYLFGRKESMHGALRGKVSVKDIREEEAHEDLYR